MKQAINGLCFMQIITIKTVKCPYVIYLYFLNIFKSNQIFLLKCKLIERVLSL